jgi:BirA family transcriptional regulator, biotin operon repressor / biotin---[acetyl-CoA-carboxylase] ligase
MNIIRFETLDSTNTYLKTHYLELPHLSVITAKHQTSGRGRLSRIWQDDGTMALFSILLKSGLDLKKIEMMPLLMAAALHQVLIPYLPDLLIKWPNDLVLRDLKLGGILSESIMEGRNPACLIIGTGINVQTMNFPEELKRTATSLYLETDKLMDIDGLILEILSTFKNTLDAFEQGSFDVIDYCNRFSSLKNRIVHFFSFGLEVTAQVVRIEHDGSLSVLASDGLKLLRSGEVTLSKL